MSMLITNITLNGEDAALYIEKNRISSIYRGDQLPPKVNADQLIDGGGAFIVPGLKNGHTHAAMTLLRGFADDMKLQPWLEQKIWPIEAKLTAEDIYWGTRLAALEMIKSGTTFFTDMYFHYTESRQAIHDTGIKAATGPALLDFFDEETGKNRRREMQELLEKFGNKDPENDPILFTPAPHSIYTVSSKTLRWIGDFTRDNQLPLHIHVSETKKEVDDCIAQNGMRPIEYLDSLGVLSPRTLAAHNIWLDEKELDILAKRGVTVVHNPVSNMKLSSGSCFPFKELRDRNIRMMIGTDGCSSNNNLDLFEEMKIAALLQKHHFGDPELMSAEEIFAIGCGASTGSGAEQEKRAEIGGPNGIFPNISSKIEEGAHADLLLINPDHVQMTPTYNLISNLVYSAGAGAVDTVVCNGEVLMRGGKVDTEEETIRHARRCAKSIAERF